MDNDIQKIIRSIILNGESPKEARKGELISARNILLAEKERQIEKDADIKDTIRLLQRNMPFLENISFYQNIKDFDHKSIILWLKFNGSYNIRYNNSDNYVMLVYKNGTLDFLNPTGVCDWFRKIVLIKDKEQYTYLAKYGMENHFNVNPVIHTISDNFRIYAFDNIFSVEIKGDKQFKLYHLYKETNQKNSLETKDGSFHITTNISSLKRLFSDKKNFKDEKKVTTFLNNMKVYESDVPSYIKEKIKRI